MKKLLLAFCIVALVAACAREVAPEYNEPLLSFTAYQEGATESRTVVVDGGTEVFWEPGDEIRVFSGSRSGRFTSSAEGLEAVTTFTGHMEGSGAEASDYWAVYPYDENASFDGETITTVIPSEQVARPGTFAQGANVTIAHSNTTELQFYNVCGGIRFTVNEEGIKKVVFEGLDGETLAGKVRIGFESGLPVIKEVADGSMFITIFPFSGETFIPGEWYYMVAIPGTLDQGIKFRFYKDDSYARLVSEKPKQIKRHIFGSVESIDQNCTFEPFEKCFPQTEEEFEESVEMSASIAETVQKLIDSGQDTDALAQQVEQVDGVSLAVVSSDKSTLMVMQQDSVWINYLLDDGGSVDISAISLGSSEMSITHQNSQIQKLNAKSGKKALILAPFQDEIGASVAKWRDWLSTSYDNVTVRTNDYTTPDAEKPEIQRFDGDELSNYDFILINTHGGTGYYAKMKDSFWAHITGHTDEPDPESYVYEQNILISCTEYNSKTADILLKKHSIEEVAIVNVERTIKGEKKNVLYFAMTPRFLKNASFNNSVVMLQACASAMFHNGEDGSLVQAFLDKGAACVTGYTVPANADLNNIITTDMLYSALKGGFSFYDAYHFWQSSSLYPVMSEALRQQAGYPPGSYSGLNYKYFKIYPEDGSGITIHNISPVFYDPIPDSPSQKVLLQWSLPLSEYDYTSHLFTYQGISGAEYYNYHFSIVYDVYVDDVLMTGSGLTETYYYASCPLGEHTYYVVARIMHEGKTVSEIKSDKQSFFFSLPVNNIEFESDIHILIKGEQKILSTSNKPSAVTNEYLKWSSSNTSIATVDKYGKVTAIKEGKATITASSFDDSVTASCEVTVYDNRSLTSQGKSFKAVDLGLSIKWASCNLGASLPEEYGDHFAWGETSSKTEYTWETYKWSEGTENEIKKYCTDSSIGYNGYIDYKCTLDGDDDAAHILLGGKWRMPTAGEFDELYRFCTVESSTLNGVNGIRMTSNINGNDIFLPLAGYMNGSMLYDAGTYRGFYWHTNLLWGDYSPMGGNICIQIDDTSPGVYTWSYRYLGYSIRPVCSKD